MRSVWNEILAETRALLESEGRANRGMITLSPETAALLDALPSASAPTEAAAEAPTPVSAVAPPVPPVAPKAIVDTAGLDSLEAVAEMVSTCVKCPLCETRMQTVFGTGDPNADLVFVGEAPGADEDRAGEPFVGKAGQLLTDIIEKGMKRPRGSVYICNVIKCRPPQNRDPSPEEVAQCEPYLVRQLELVKPKVICALGRHAAQTLLKSSESLGRMRGKWHDYNGVPVRVTYHPSYILRCHGDKLVEEKGKVWEDIQAVMGLLKDNKE